MRPLPLADPEARRRVVWWFVIATAVGLLLIAAGEHWRRDLHSWIEGNVGFFVANPIVVTLLALLFMAPVIGLAVYMFRLGARAASTQRFPPPEYAAIRDTPPLEGRAASRRGRIVQSLSLLLLLAATAVPLLVWRLLRLLVSAA